MVNPPVALISVGSGGLTGKGWRQGTQYALGFLPSAGAHNDFIFSVIAEEKGFLGSVTVLGLYTVILFTGLKIAGQARDRLGKLLAVGVTIPGLDMAAFALMLCLTLGLMGMLTPYATGPSPVYYGSGYLPARDYWLLGGVFGLVFIAAFLLIGMPWMAMLR